MGAFKVTITAEDESRTDSESTGLVGATCHMYNKKELFANFQGLQVPVNVTLSDGREYLVIHAIGRGDVVLKMNLLHVTISVYSRSKTLALTSHN